MAERYWSREDVITRLDCSICLFEGMPYYVSCGHGSNGDEVDLFYMRPSPKIYKRVNYTLDTFVDRSLPLGYMNWNSNCHYVTRTPQRRNIQPIHSTHLSCNPRLDANWFISEEFANCILGIYPSYQEAMRRITDELSSGVAVHRDVALASRPETRQLGLYYKDRAVAFWNVFNRTWDYVPSPESIHLRKIVEKLGCVG